MESWIIENELEDCVDILKKHRLCKERTLLLLSKEDIRELSLAKGDELLLIEAVTQLQTKHGSGPCVNVPPAPRTPPSAPLQNNSLEELLNELGSGRQVPNATGKTGENHLRIIDFVPNGLITANEEIDLPGKVTIKFGGKPKLEKVSQAMWTVANTRILKKLRLTITNFDTDAYLKYTEMIGEMACRFTWLSVLHFDEEYRQRQAAQGFAWGTEAPHLSTVTLRDRPAHSQVGLRRGGDKERQAGALGRDYCRQWNAGSCSYGAKCRFDHLCSTCGKDHPARDHAVAATTARATSA